MSAQSRKEACRKCKRRRGTSDLLDGDLCRSCHASTAEHRYQAGDNRQTDSVVLLKARVAELEAELRSIRDEQTSQPQAKRSRPVSLSSGSASNDSPATIPDLLPALSSAMQDKTKEIVIKPADLEALAERLTISTHGEAFPYGPTSNLLLVADSPPTSPSLRPSLPPVSFLPIGTTPALIDHLLSLYFRWHHPVFIFFSKPSFLSHSATGGKYCTPLLLNAVLAYASTISDEVQIRSNPADPSTAGDAFMTTCRSMLDGELHSSPSVTTVSALNLMAKREAALGRANLGWLYSGIAFRIAIGLGCHLDPSPLVTDGLMSEEDARVRKAVFWGCYANDKAWSAYLGRPNSIRPEIVTTPRLTDWQGESVTAVHSSSPDYLNYPGLLHSNTLFYCFVDIWDLFNTMLTRLYHNSTHPSAREAAQPALKLAEEVREWKAALPACAQLGPGFSGPIVTLLHMLSENVVLLAFRPLVDVRNLEPTPRSRCLASAKKICHLLEQYRTSFGLRIISLNLIYVVSTAATVLIYERSRGTAQDLFELSKLCLSSLDEIGANGWRSAIHAVNGLRKLEQQAVARPRDVRRSSSSYSQGQADALLPAQQPPAFPFRTHQPMASQMDMNFGHSEQPLDNSMKSFNSYHFGAGQQGQQPWIVGDDSYFANFGKQGLF